MTEPRDSVAPDPEQSDAATETPPAVPPLAAGGVPNQDAMDDVAAGIASDIGKFMAGASDLLKGLVDAIADDLRELGLGEAVDKAGRDGDQ